MSSIKKDTEIIRKAVAWTLITVAEIESAGGASHVLLMIPADLLDTLVRNDLYIVYKGQGNRP